MSSDEDDDIDFIHDQDGEINNSNINDYYKTNNNYTTYCKFNRTVGKNGVFYLDVLPLPHIMGTLSKWKAKEPARHIILATLLPMDSIVSAGIHG